MDLNIKLIMKNLLILLTLFFLICSCNKQQIQEQDVIIPVKLESDGLWGFINPKGEMVIEPEFNQRPSPFYDGYSIIKMRGNYRFIDTDGEVTDDKYVDISPFSEGFACVVKENDHPKIINKEFKIIAVLNFAQLVGTFREGRAQFKNKNGKWGFINTTGEIVIKAKYDEVLSFSNGAARVKLGKKTGYISTEGEDLFPLTEKFSRLKSFSEDLAAYSNGNGWGYINKKGEKVIKARDTRDFVGFFQNGYASYCSEGLWGLIDNKGDKVITAKYDDPLFFSDNVSVYSQKGKYGFIKENGDKLIRADYFTDVALPFISGNAIVEEDGYYVVVDKTSETRSKNEFSVVDKSLYLNYKKYGHLFNPEITVTSDYYNVPGLLKDLYGLMDVNKIREISKGTTLKQLIQIDDKWNEVISDRIGTDKIKREVKISPNVSATITIHFEDKLNMWNASAFEYVRNEEALVSRITISSKFTGKPLQKINNIYAALNRKISQIGYTIDNNESLKETSTYAPFAYKEEENVVISKKYSNSITVTFKLI